MNSKADVRHAGRWAGWPLVLATVGAFALVGATATTARADSNFERGFEDQMGRILAYEAVNLGKHVLFQGVFQPQRASYGYGDDHRYSRHDRHRHRAKHYTRYDRGHGPSHNHWKRHDDRRHYRKHARHDRHDRRHRRHDRRHRGHRDCDRHDYH